MEKKPIPFWKSKTFWGIIATIVQIFLKKQFNFELPVIGEEGGLAVYGLAKKVERSGMSAIIIMLIGAGLFSACSPATQLHSTTINSVEVSGSSVKVAGHTHLNIPYDKIDSATTAVTKKIFIIKDVIPDSTGVGFDWLLTTPGGK